MSGMARLIDRPPTIPVAALGALGALGGVVLVAFRSWSGGLILSLGLLVLVAVPALGWRMEYRLAALFGLWSVSDLIKKMTFLLPAQQQWAQFGPFLLPYAFFALAILIPWIGTRVTLRPTKLQFAVGTYVLVAVLNTWLSSRANLIAKGASTALLIMPWAMIAVAASYPNSIARVCRVFVTVSVASAIYGGLQFVLGPTPIELHWGQATSELSIGASQLAAALAGEKGVFLWRIVGFQADEFTFALFMINGLTAAWLLHARGELRRPHFLTVSGVFLVAIGLSIVRTAWVATIALIGFVHIARRFRVITRPAVVTGICIGMFFMGDFAAISLEGLRGFAQESLPPVLRRTVTLGTLDARAGATRTLVRVLEDRTITGEGYGIAAWITNKFGGFELIPNNFASHNAVVEILWYVGLPGLAAAAIVLIHAVGRGWRAERAGHLPRGQYTIMLGYVICMYMTGLSIAGVFLSFPFFYFLGSLAASPNRVPADQDTIG